MAFPTTGLLHDFTGTAGTIPPSADWTNLIAGTGSGIKIVSNNCGGNIGGDGTFSSGWWNLSTYGPDCEVYCVVPTRQLTTPARILSLFLGLITPGSSSVDGYRFDITTDTATTPDDFWKITRVDNNVGTQLGSTVGQAYASGDSFGAERIGSTLTGYLKTGGVWSSVITQSDSTYTSAGYIGVQMEDSVFRIDDFSGGTVVSAASGGTWTKTIGAGLNPYMTSITGG